MLWQKILSSKLRLTYIKLLFFFRQAQQSLKARACQPTAAPHISVGRQVNDLLDSLGVARVQYVEYPNLKGILGIKFNNPY